MNESSPSSPSVQSPSSPLRYLQEIIQNRIIQKKSEMHQSHNKVYLESLWTDRNITMGISANTYATATIISHQELAAHFGPNYHLKFLLHTFSRSTSYSLGKINRLVFSPIFH